jgi:opacity protein-like surface antigen
VKKLLGIAAIFAFATAHPLFADQYIALGGSYGNIFEISDGNYRFINGPGVKFDWLYFQGENPFGVWLGSELVFPTYAKDGVENYDPSFCFDVNIGMGLRSSIADSITLYGGVGFGFAFIKSEYAVRPSFFSEKSFRLGISGGGGLKFDVNDRVCLDI